jgi:cytochrome P450
VLGVSSEDIPQLAEWVFPVLHTEWPAHGVADHTKPDERKGVVGSAPGMCAFFDQLMAERIKEDHQDLISEMARIEMDGDQHLPIEHSWRFPLIFTNASRQGSSMTDISSISRARLRR